MNGFHLNALQRLVSGLASASSKIEEVRRTKQHSLIGFGAVATQSAIGI